MKLAMEIDKFNAALARSKRDLPATKLIPFQQKLVLLVLRGIIYKTPVDTGQARGGWQIGVNRLPRARTAKDTNGASAFQKGAARVRGISAYSTTYVANNVGHIVYLEEGSSAQAPFGMVRLTLAEVRSQIPQLIRTL